LSLISRGTTYFTRLYFPTVFCADFLSRNPIYLDSINYSGDIFLGEVFKPEDISKRKEMKDLGPKPFPPPVTASSLDDLIREVRELKIEVENIKRILRSRGIPV
jgi:hypothetical protein